MEWIWLKKQSTFVNKTINSLRRYSFSHFDLICWIPFKVLSSMFTFDRCGNGCKRVHFLVGFFLFCFSVWSSNSLSFLRCFYFDIWFLKNYRYGFLQFFQNTWGVVQKLRAFSRLCFSERLNIPLKVSYDVKGMIRYQKTRIGIPFRKRHLNEDLNVSVCMTVF